MYKDRYVYITEYLFRYVKVTLLYISTSVLYDNCLFHLHTKITKTIIILYTSLLCQLVKYFIYK